jgi:hypothetical protein
MREEGGRVRAERRDRAGNPPEGWSVSFEPPPTLGPCPTCRTVALLYSDGCWDCPSCGGGPGGESNKERDPSGKLGSRKVHREAPASGVPAASGGHVRGAAGADTPARGEL